MAWIGDAVGMSLSAAALAVVSILAIYFACRLLFPHSSRGRRLEGAIPAEVRKEDEEEAYETAEEENVEKDEGDEAAEGKTEKKEEVEERGIGKEEKKDDEERGIAWILSPLNSFQAYFSSPAPTPLPLNVLKKLDLLKLNDDVYELCKPSGRPSVEIVFFHGFQLGGSRQTYATTWLSRNGSELWPNWIRKSVPEVRILLVSYDGSSTKKVDRGGTDMYVTSENLVQSLTSNAAHVGQDGCPVILVGHSLGGLVMKEILLEANKVLSFNKPENPNWRVRSFLENVKQLFYYSCPHNGIRLADDKRVSQQGELFQLLTTLSTKAARRNEEFRKLREKYKWGAYSIAEKLPTDLGSLGKQVVAEEPSTRQDTDDYYTADADHFSVCQPASDTDSSFSKLRDIIHSTRREVVPGHQIKTPTTLVGLNDPITQVTTRLRTTQYLSICGIGGIGKSTLAMAVYNAISGNFEYTSFVSEVKKKLVGEQVSTENLQEEILKNLYYKGNKTEHKWDRLEGKRVLIILDDVENESQVFVMPKTDRGVRFFSDESRVLVTCRDRRIVSSKDFEVHDAKFLGEAASRRLFCSHAFKEEHAPKGYEDDVEKFVGKCGGLPLALEVTGKFLYTRRDKAIWNGAFQRLSAAQSLGGSRNDRLWSIFEVIYEDLEEEEQQMFLDIATCFHGDRKETANSVWRCCDWVITADVGWQNLVDIGFVRADNKWGPERIWMHELLRDFGRRKANPGSIESYSRVCYRSELPPWPFKEGTTPLVKFLRITADGWDGWDGFGAKKSHIDIDIERLRGLENLKVLLLEGVTVYGAFNLLPDNLEVLIMKKCRWRSRSSKTFYVEDDYEIPRHDRCFTLGESSAPKSGQHVSLRHMDFGPEQGSLDPLFLYQSFEYLPALEYLRISVDPPERISITGNPLEETMRLVSPLNIRNFVNFWERTPQASPPCLRSLSDSLGQLRKLRELDICLESLTRLPDSLGHLNSLPKLSISCGTLTRLPESLGQLKSPQELAIHCTSLTRLPESLGQLQSLRELEIDSSSLTRLPESLGQLQSLQGLVIRCESLICLPDSLGQLQSLQKLVIRCESLICLPDSLGQLQSLQKLVIRCESLICLPDSLVQLQSLRELTIRSFSLTHLPDSLKQLQSLQKLVISCQSLTAFPDILEQLGDLQELRISCPGLTALPDNLGQLGRLVLLEISGCDGLTALPDTLGQLDGLRELIIYRCERLTALPDNLGQLGGLRELNIDGCERLTALPDNLGQLGGLRELNIDGCERLTALPDNLGQLGGLQKLEIRWCRSLTVLPDNLGHLGGLQVFVIDSCRNLETLPDALGDLHALQYLEVTHCTKLEALPDTVTKLDCVKKFKK